MSPVRNTVVAAGKKSSIASAGQAAISTRMAPQQQLVKLIRLGMEHLASSPRAKVYCATNRGNPHLVPVKMNDSRRIPGKIFLTPCSLYENICEHKPFAEAGIGAPSRPLHDTLRLGFTNNSSFGLKDEHALYRI